MPNQNPFSDLSQWISMLNQLNQLLNSELSQPFRRLQRSTGFLPDDANAYDRSRNASVPPSLSGSTNPAPLGLNLQEMARMLNQINQFLNSSLAKNLAPPGGASRASNPSSASDFQHLLSLMQELGNLFKNLRLY